MTLDPRTERLQSRFNAIAKGLELATSRDLAFLAKIASWGMVMEHAIEQMMEDLTTDPSLLKQYQSELGPMLQQLFTEMSLHLKVDPQQALDLVDCFHEVMKDMLAKRG